MARLHETPLPYSVQLYVPTFDCDGEPLAGERVAIVGSKVKAMLREWAGSITMMEGLEEFVDSGGVLSIEPVVTVVAYSSLAIDSAMVQRVVELIMFELRQDVVPVRLNGVAIQYRWLEWRDAAEPGELPDESAA